MKTSIPTTALVALYLSLASSASASGGAGSIDALLSRIASQHSKALPSNAAGASLVPVTTVASGSAPQPTVLQPGAVVFNPKSHIGGPAPVKGGPAIDHTRMSKKVKKRAMEEQEPDSAPQALFKLGPEAKRAEHEKRWIWAHSIIQDGDTGAGIPTDGSNANLLSGSGWVNDPAATPTATMVAPSFPPRSSATPAPATVAPSASASASVAPSFAAPKIAVVSSATPVAASSSASVVVPVVQAVASSSAAPVVAAPAASSSAAAAVLPGVASAVVAPVANLVHNLLPVVAPTSVSSFVPVSATSAPVASASASAVTKLFADVHHHRHAGLAVKAKKAAAAEKAKRWVWGSSIIQDGDAAPSQHETPEDNIVTPTFPPLAEATASVVAAFSAPEEAATTSAPAVVAELALESAVNVAVVEASATTTTEAAPVSTTAAALTGDWLEQRLAAIEAGFEKAEAAVVGATYGRHKRSYQEYVIAQNNQKRVQKLVKKTIVN